MILKFCHLPRYEFSGIQVIKQNSIPENKRFKGKAILLFNSGTWSAAIDTASAFEYNRMGVTIGTETGGRESFCGDIISIELTNSHLVYQTPICYSVSPDGDTNNGVIPDIEIKYRANDVKSSNDKFIEAEIIFQIRKTK